MRVVIRGSTEPPPDPWRRMDGGVPALFGDVHVWRIDLGGFRGHIERFGAVMSHDEQARARCFHFRRDRERYTVARGSLRLLLGRYLDLPPERVTFGYGRYGKPELKGGDIGFNSSHSGTIVLHAFARAARVGVDVEAIRPEVVREGLEATVFSPGERAAFRRLPEAAAVPGFFSVWTRKEAYIKAVGAGFSYPLRAFSVSVGVNRPAQLIEDTAWGAACTRWTMQTLAPGAGYAGAVVYEGEPRTVRLFASASAAPLEPDEAVEKAVASPYSAGEGCLG